MPALILPTTTIVDPGGQSLGNVLVSNASVSPFAAPGSWDELVLGGGDFSWKGRVDFVGAKRAFSWQHKVPPGVKGDVNTFRGTHCHSFTMRLYVWTDAQWQMLPDLLSFFQYDGTHLGADGTPLAYPCDIYHPALAYLDIHQVLCEEIHAPEVDKEHSGAVWLGFRLHEFLPQVAGNVTTTPLRPQTPFLVKENAGVPAQIKSQAGAVLDLAAQLSSSLP